MYIYVNHMGGFFTSDEELEFDMLHCEECGDTDWLIGKADNRKEAWDLLQGMVDIDGSGGYDVEYTRNFIKENFSK